MLHLYTTAVLLAAILSLASAFQLSFYTGPHCDGDWLDTRQAIKNGTCHDPSHLGKLSNSVEVTREASDDFESMVQFYSGDVNCSPDNYVSAANTGCISVSHRGSFGGYDVVAVGGGSKRGSNRRKGIAHGDFFEYNGEDWRWIQVGKDAFTSCRAEEWDREPRVANFTPLDYGKDSPFNFTEYDLSHASEKVE